jgi:hypothetical protein
MNAFQKFREVTVHRGGLVFVLVWGVLFFGGFTFALDVSDQIFIKHKSMGPADILSTVLEKLLVGIIWGTMMWLLRDSSKKEGPAK